MKNKVVNLKDLKPGDMFRRVGGEYRYIVSSQREEHCGNISIYCYNLDGDSDGYNHGGSENVIQIPHAGYEDPQPRCFWMCYAEGSGAPNHIHRSPTEANIEAERLAEHTGRRVFVLTASACVIHIPPVKHAGYKWSDIQN